MAREYPRSRRIGDQIQRELAQLIREEVKDPRVGMVTVSAVEVTRDIAYAKVFVTVLDPKQDTVEVVKALNGAAAFLRRALSQRMLIRSVPQLQFVHDESIERGARLSSLIDAAVAADAKRAQQPEGKEGEEENGRENEQS